MAEPTLSESTSENVESPASEATVAGNSALNSRNKLVITLLLISAFVVILNETIMGVAIPRLERDLGITANAAQWLTTAFMLTMAVVIPITGFVLQRYNTRPVFMAAMTLFSLGTLIAAIAPGFEVLIVARVIQASGTAIMMPLLFTTVLNLVPPASRGRAATAGAARGPAQARRRDLVPGRPSGPGRGPRRHRAARSGGGDRP